METNAIDHLDAVLPKSRFEFGEYIKEGFATWKQHAGAFIGFGLLYMVISTGLSFIPFVGSVVSSLVITPCLTAGAYYYSHNSRAQNFPEFNNFFEKFNSFVPILTLNLIVSLISIVLFLPFIFSIGFENITGIVSGNPDLILEIFEDFNPIKILFLIPSFFVLSLIGFGLPFIIFYDLSPMDALRYSVKFIFKHWIAYVAFLIVVSMISMSGVIACGVGIIATYTFIFPMSYEAFRGLTDLGGYNSGDKNPDLLDNLIEA